MTEAFDENEEETEATEAADAPGEAVKDVFWDFDSGDGFGFGSSLWDGDEGTLTDRQRDTLVVLLKHEYISADTYTREYKTLTENPSVIRSMLNNLYLELHIDTGREIAYKRPVRSEGRKFRTILHDASYNREETLLLVFLREQFRAEGAAGAVHVFVDTADMQDYVARFRPEHDTDEAGGRRKVDNAIVSLKKTKLIKAAAGGGDDRFEISRAIETLLPVDRLNTLLEALREQNGSANAVDSETDELEVVDV
ncbi:MAG TPA: DUF4194 domain-containing protein [Nocardioidaceae bacterium]|nr:DUF4194 domain-containing protein [Nocardioidaceae bacterium]